MYLGKGEKNKNTKIKIKQDLSEEHNVRKKRKVKEREWCRDFSPSPSLSFNHALSFKYAISSADHATPRNQAVAELNRFFPHRVHSYIMYQHAY